MLIPFATILAYAAGVATAVPVTVYIHGLITKARAFEAKEKAAAIAEIKNAGAAVLADIAKI